jgi:hypothetical protein
MLAFRLEASQEKESNPFVRYLLIRVKGESKSELLENGCIRRRDR